MCVGPKRVMTGVPKAAAKWRGPESVVTSRADRRTQAFDRPRLSAASARLTTRGWSASAGDLAGRVSLAGPAEDQDRDARLVASRRASAAKDAAGQLFAGPNAPPVFRQTTGLSRAKSQLGPGPIGGRLVVGCGGQLELDRLDAAAQHLAQAPGNTRRSEWARSCRPGRAGAAGRRSGGAPGRTGQ